MDITPLRENPNYRWLFLGQLISAFGSMITYVAIPFQMYEITHSTFYVGLLGVVQLIPLIVAGFWGGALADSMERKKLIIMTEALLAIGNLMLIVFTIMQSRNHYFLFILAGIMATLKGLERPALEALTQQLIPKKDIPKVSTLQSFKTTTGMIMGPAIGGILISSFGISITYFVDFLTYLFSIFFLLKVTNISLLVEKRKVNLGSIQEGFLYAIRRPDLLGTYLVDMASMTFAFPNALFPAMALAFGDSSRLGWLYSATAVGAFIASMTSKWTHKSIHHGRFITIAALFWCVGIIFFGISPNFYISLVLLAFAGFADMISGIFRATMWNETIPQEFRGRLASVEMISYSSGPLLGSTFMGAMAENIGQSQALISGGLIGSISVLVIGIGIRGFWNYRATRE